MSEVKRINTFFNLAVDGFRAGHPIGADWSFLKWGLDRWPDHEMGWFLFAKFLAIFTEQCLSLAWVHSSIITRRIKGSATRVVKGRSRQITQEREMNLIPDLKYRLKQFSKLFTGTKTKLRRLWDLVIQGNITENTNVESGRLQEGASVHSETTESDAGVEQGIEIDEDATLIASYIADLSFPAVTKDLFIQILLLVVFICG
jgi:hypothetical protein